MKFSSSLLLGQRAALIFIATLTSPTFAKVHHLFVGQLSSSFNNVNLTIPPTIYTLAFDDATNNLKLISNLTVPNNAIWVATSPDKKSLFSTSGNGWAQFPITHQPPAPLTLGALNKITSTSSCNVGPTANQFVFSSTGNLYGCFWAVGNGTGSSDPANCGEVVAPSKSGTYSSLQPFEFGPHPNSSIHGLALSPDNNWLYSADMKSDILYTHSVNHRTGLVNTDTVGKRPVLPSGSHPRHVAVHTSGKRVYTIQEGANTLNEYDSSGKHASNPILIKEWDLLASLSLNRSQYWSSEVVVNTRGTYIFASTRAREEAGDDASGYYNIFRANKKNGKIERVARRERTKYTDTEISLQFRVAKWSPKGVTYLANPRVNYGEGQAGVEVLKWDEKRERLEFVADLQIEDKGCCATVDWLGD